MCFHSNDLFEYYDKRTLPLRISLSLSLSLFLRFYQFCTLQLLFKTRLICSERQQLGRPVVYSFNWYQTPKRVVTIEAKLSHIPIVDRLQSVWPGKITRLHSKRTQLSADGMILPRRNSKGKRTCYRHLWFEPVALPTLNGRREDRKRRRGESVCPTQINRTSLFVSSFAFSSRPVDSR